MISGHSMINTHQFKVLVVGSAGAGKTALVKSILNSGFDEKYVPTLGSDCFIKRDTVQGDKAVLRLWDTAGLRRYRPVIQQLYDRVRGVLLCYDCTSDESFKEVVYWYTEMSKSCPEAAIVLVGLKCDLSEQIIVSEADGDVQAKEWGLAHVHASSKTGANVDKVSGLLTMGIKKPLTSG